MIMPKIIPIGWKPFRGIALKKETLSGLCVLYSIDKHGYSDIDCPPMGAGFYSHISISRKDKYPEWDEMRDFIYSCGFFDSERDVCMFLPPKKQYINVHPNCFHFYQKK